MKIENELKLPIKFNELNEFIYNIDNLTKWISYIEQVDWITPPPPMKGSYLAFLIKLFGKAKQFNFKISEFEKNKKIKLKAMNPYILEITIRTFQSVDNLSYIVLKTKVKPFGLLKLLYPLNKSILSSKNKLSIDILRELLVKEGQKIPA